MKIKWSSILPMLVIPIVWLTHPYVTSSYIDDSDTSNYGAYFGTVGFRLPIAALVNLFTTNGLTPSDAALFLNSVAIFYMFYLLGRLDSLSRNSHTGWTYLGIVLSSPLIVLTKQNMSTDWYAGLLFAHFFLKSQELGTSNAQERMSSWREQLVLALLAVFAVNVKETAWIALFSYALVLMFSRPRIDFREILKFIVALGLVWIVWRALYAFVYGEMFYDYWKIFLKPKGGSGPHEIVGARASVPVPLFLFHLYNQLKLVGRCGISSAVVLISLVFLRTRVIAQVYLVGLAVFTVIAFWGYLTSERYFAIFLPIQLMLYLQVLDQLRENPRWRYVPIIILTLGVCLSLANYVFRYFPAIYHLFTVG